MWQGDNIDPGEIKRILEVLAVNKDKNFVDRIINPNQYPSIKNEDGTVSTHLMSWGETDGRYIVYPNIVYDEATKRLTKHKGKQGFDKAIKSGGFIEFKTPEEADWFTKNYKKFWK